MNEPMTAEQFLNLIDDFYRDAKKNKVSRFDEKWGKWSTRMNLELKQRINGGTDPEEIKLKHIVQFWVVKSQLLELHFKGKMFKGGLKKRLVKEAATARKIILSEGDGLVVPELENGTFADVVLKRLLG